MLLKKLLLITGSSTIQYIVVLAAISVILAVVLILFRSALHDIGAHTVNSMQTDIVVPNN